MFVRTLAICASLLVVLPIARAEKEPPKGKEEAKAMEWTGKLQTGIVAIGGETTGTVLETKDGKLELDFGKNKEMRAAAEKLNGKSVVVKGTLMTKKGLAIKERKIITVTEMKEAQDKK